MALEELDDRRREVQRFRPVQNVLLGQFVGDHELSKVSDNL